MKETETKAPVTAEQPAGGNKVKRVLKVIFNSIINILIVVVLIVSLLIAVMALTSKANGVSQIFGYTIQTIQSDSMKGGSPDGYEGGDFEEGDLVIGKSTNFNDFAEYNVGDIITYKGVDADDVPFLMAHRIVDKVKGQDGYYRYQTWGDNRKVSEVPDQLTEDKFLAAYDIASVLYDKDYHCTVIKGVGGFLDKLQKDRSFFFLVVLLPMIIFFMYALIRVVLSSLNYRKEKEKELVEEATKDKQAEIDAAVAAALAAQNGTEEQKPAEAEAPADMTPEQMEQFKQFLAFQKAQQAQQSAEQSAEDNPEEESPSEE